MMPVLDTREEHIRILCNVLGMPLPKEALSESDLPYKVDIVDLATVAPAFGRGSPKIGFRSQSLIGEVDNGS